MKSSGTTTGRRKVRNTSTEISTWESRPLASTFIFSTEVVHIQNVTHHARYPFGETAKRRWSTLFSVIWSTYSSLITNVSKQWRTQYIHHWAVNSFFGFFAWCHTLFPAHYTADPAQTFPKYWEKDFPDTVLIYLCGDCRSSFSHWLRNVALRTREDT